MNDIKPAFGVELQEPYFNRDRWVSPLNWLPEVTKQIQSPEQVKIHDVTLRDGEQMARIAFTPEEKIFIAKELDKLGVHSIEPGLPVTPEDVAVIKELANAGMNAKIVPLVRVKESDVKATIDAKADGMLLEFGINPFLVRDVYSTTPEALKEQISEYSKEGKKAGLYTEFMGWDVLRIPDMNYIRSFFEAIIEHGDLDRITIADTFGMGHPLATYHLIKKLKEWTGKPVGYHIHNDYGMATANSVMAISAGADMVHSSINGLGERTGNVATEEISFVLQHLLDIDAGIDLSRLKIVSDLVAEISKFKLAPNKPVVGDGIFELESGIVLHILNKLEDTPLDGKLFPFSPETVGHEPYQAVFGRGSGNYSVKKMLRQKNLDATDEQVLSITNQIKEAGLIIKNGLTESLIDQIIEEVLAE